MEFGMNRDGSRGESVESFEPTDGSLEIVEPTSGDSISEEDSMSGEMEQVFVEMRRLFGFERMEDGRKMSISDELKRLLPVLQGVNSVQRSHAVATLEDRIQSNSEQIRNLQSVLKQAELRKMREEEDEQYMELEQRLEELRYDLVMTHREAAELQTEAKEMTFDLQRKRKQVKELKAREEELAKPKVNILSKKLEELPQKLSKLRRDLYKMEDDLQREKFLEKDVIRSLEASEGTKRRTEQMIEILQKEVVQMQQREEEAGKEAAEVGEALRSAEVEFENCRRDATGSTQDLLKRMQELYDIQDALLQEIKQHHENKVFKAIGARAAQQAHRMKSILTSLTNMSSKDTSTVNKEKTTGSSHTDVTSSMGNATVSNSAKSWSSKTSSTDVSESRRRVQELSRILSEKEEHTKALETKVDLLKQRVETTERRLELARQERVKNARSLGAEKIPSRGQTTSPKTKPVTKEFYWLDTKIPHPVPQKPAALSTSPPP